MSDLIELITLGISAMTLIGLIVNTYGTIRSLNAIKKSIGTSSAQNCAKCGKPVDAHTVAEARGCGLIK